MARIPGPDTPDLVSASPDSTSATLLRPMNLGDLLDQSFRLYRSHFLVSVGIVAVISIPLAIVQGFAAWRYATFIAQFMDARNGDGIDPTANPMQMGIDALTSVGPFFLSLILTGVGSMFATGALATAISALYLGRNISIGQAYRAVLKRIGTLIRYLLLVGSVFIGGYMVLIALFVVGALLTSLSGDNFAGTGVGIALICLAIPITLVFFVLATVLWVRWHFVTQAITLENSRARQGMRRSWQLTKGSAWRVFGIMLLLGLMVAIISAVPTYIAAFGAALFVSDIASQTVINQVLSSAVSILLTPIQLIATTLLYYDLRVRKEGFDLELMAQQISASATVL